MSASTLIIDPTGANNSLTYTAADDGVEFNALSIAYIDPGAASQSLAVTFDGKNIRVLLATDGSSVITSTAALVNAAVCGKKAANTLTSNNTNVSDGDTVTIGGTTYRFKTVTAQANDIFIGANADATLGSLVKVLNGNATIAASGADAFTGTKNGHALVSAGAVTSHATLITARAPGAQYNSVPTTKSAVTLTWTDTATLGGASANTIGADSIDTSLDSGGSGAATNSPRRTMYLMSCANTGGNDGTGLVTAMSAAFFSGSTLEPTTGYASVTTAQAAGWVFLGVTSSGLITNPTPQNLHYGAAETWYSAYHQEHSPKVTRQSAPSAAAILIAAKLYAAQCARKGVPLPIKPWFDPTLWAR